MKLKQSQLQKIIREELKRILSEGDVIKGPWGKDEDEREYEGSPAWQQDQDYKEREAEHKERDEDELPEEFQYEYVLDELVNVARDAVMSLAIEKLKKANAFSPSGGDDLGASRMTANDVELEIEEGLLDALKPLAKTIYYKEKEAAQEDEW
tara:strand:+ start:16222 stop:16677 length:456 start_codon:yes stop_codon:yes gene_type:complete